MRHKPHTGTLCIVVSEACVIGVSIRSDWITPYRLSFSFASFPLTCRKLCGSCLCCKKAKGESKDEKNHTTGSRHIAAPHGLRAGGE